ncbi:MAG: tRNA (N(6)-L-threonylcarbamoyladenosine(37)-C(2))-methylthiotransferase MtaB [Erysipelotrichaceae bacterium]|nr:tRNA (N(6)-L-threonylcarbamoyladenosine(37)-C(2))-methylthiotransferase MtaB [Erysipelotrichaceae bacterium]
MRFSILTLGCKVNTYESQYYIEQLTNHGFEHVSDKEDTDICIINTCAVTNTAAKKSRQKIHQAKREHPNAYIVVVGCLGQFMKPENRQAMEVDCWIGAQHKNEMADTIRKMIQTKQPSDTIGDIDQRFDFESMPIHFFDQQHRAFLKIQDGCDQFCSYCAIPYARGRERSLNHKEAVRIAKDLVGKGHKEIVLTGIHTGRYTDHTMRLSDLLKACLKETGKDVHYRISSIEITEVTDELIQLIQENPRICRHLHIPIQSGCDQTLQRMNRPYTVSEFKERLAHIRNQCPDLSVSTDVIVGFCQEDEEEFHQTIQTIQDCQFSFLHVFPYSKRDGTRASHMDGEPSNAIKKDRVRQLMKLSDLMRIQDMKRFTDIEVLIERKKGNQYTGYTSQYHPVRIHSESLLKGRIITKWDTIDKDGYTVEMKEGYYASE